jgi:CBS domain-containing protein
MTTVRQIIQAKGAQVWTISPQATVLEALQLMADKNVGALLVTEGDQVAGIFSERDYARSVALKGRTAENTRVGDIMTARVIYVRPNQSMEDVMAVMTDKHIRHLPVMEDERLVGVISIGDVVKEIISEQNFTIRSLESYITGSR